ncbi:hypothetical protein HanRHA438_Chr06g0256611 [Helianthus annuus]|nr:hypothetical protein HanRHA438_Chr06g0256611 [Helianthus annuus]
MVPFCVQPPLLLPHLNPHLLSHLIPIIKPRLQTKLMFASSSSSLPLLKHRLLMFKKPLLTLLLEPMLPTLTPGIHTQNTTSQAENERGRNAPHFTRLNLNMQTLVNL